jgi:hypothetical protein
MLEEDYSKHLSKLLDTCECDLAVPSEWKDRLAQQSVIDPIREERRKYVRHHFIHRAVLECDQTVPSIPREPTLTQVVTSNVSRQGIGFLHSEQLFPGEQITLWLPIGKLAYVVERCVEHNDNCYEIGAKLAGKTLEVSPS